VIQVAHIRTGYASRCHYPIDWTVPAELSAVPDPTSEPTQVIGTGPEDTGTTAITPAPTEASEVPTQIVTDWSRVPTIPNLRPPPR
jgi:hypothetical protein